jgi:hypothetical protein
VSELSYRLVLTDRHVRYAVSPMTEEEINQKLWFGLGEKLLPLLLDGKKHTLQVLKQHDRQNLFPESRFEQRPENWNHVHTLRCFIDQWPLYVLNEVGPASLDWPRNAEHSQDGGIRVEREY